MLIYSMSWSLTRIRKVCRSILLTEALLNMIYDLALSSLTWENSSRKIFVKTTPAVMKHIWFSDCANLFTQLISIQINRSAIVWLSAWQFCNNSTAIITIRKMKKSMDRKTKILIELTSLQCRQISQRRRWHHTDWVQVAESGEKSRKSRNDWKILMLGSSPTRDAYQDRFRSCEAVEDIENTKWYKIKWTVLAIRMNVVTKGRRLLKVHTSSDSCSVS